MHSAYVGRQTLRYKEHHNTRATSFDKTKCRGVWRVAVVVVCVARVVGR